MSTEFPHDPRDEMEARLTALILGELPADQAAELRERIDQDPSLSELFQRLKQTADLLRETAVAGATANEPAAMPRLRQTRRDALLASFKTVRAPVMPRLRWSQWLVPAAAAMLVGLLFLAAVVPSLSRAKSRAQHVTPMPGALSAALASRQERLSEMPSVEFAANRKAQQSPTEVVGGLDAEARRRFMTRYGLKSPLGERSPALAGGSGGGGLGGGPPAGQSFNSASPVPGQADGNAPAPIDAGTGLPALADESVVAKDIPPVVALAAESAASVNFAVPVTQSPKPDLLYKGVSGLPRPTTQTVSPPTAGAAFYDDSGRALAFVPNSPQPPVQSAVETPIREDAVTVREPALAPPATPDVPLKADVDSLGIEELDRKAAVENKQQLHAQFGDFDVEDFNAAIASKERFAKESTLSGTVTAGRGYHYSAIGKPPALAPTITSTNGAVGPERRKLTESAAKAEAGTPLLSQGLASTGGESATVVSRDEMKQGLIGTATRELKQVEEKDKVAERPATPPPIPQPEMLTRENRFSTFSLNVSDVSYKLSASSLEKGQLPDPATIRSEEFLNAFDYHDPEPGPGAAIAFNWEIARSPYAHNRDLVRFSIKTAAQGRQNGRPLNVVVLLDNSGSMERADRVRIIQSALKTLGTQLQPQDRLSIVLFSRTARLWVDGVAGNEAAGWLEQAGTLVPQGGTNLEEAMNLAYQTALRHYLATGINRVILLTDGAANLGNVEPSALKEKVERFRKQGVALDCFGIGWEGYNDELMESLARNGDGRYGFINTPEEAGTEFVAQLAGALRVAASDVKVQVEFNPDRVNAYRQIGYAKHQLTKEQFRDNTVDAAEIGAAESGNALYAIEVNPAGLGPVATLRVRYKVPGTSEYKELEWLVPYNGASPALSASSPAMRLAVTASAFSEWLANNPYAGEVTPDGLLTNLQGVPQAFSVDSRPTQLEWMIRQAKSLTGK
jgi:Mg-chelatase subunit ChlD